MAAQFDVYRLSDKTLVVILQSDIVNAFKSRLVAPLVPAQKAGRVLRGLNPMIEVSQQNYVLMPQLAGAIAVSELVTHIGSLAYKRDEIIRALDLLFTGF